VGSEITKLGAAQVRFNRYESVRRIAVGGMAEIFLARAKGMEGFEKLVVLKKILAQYAANAEFVGMFLDEGRIASTLRHPNIGQVTDIGMTNGQYFLVMEFLHGVDVRRLLRKLAVSQRRLPLDHAVAIAIGMCAGLHHAHEHVGLDGKPLNLVHRDVSPQNVFVTYDGSVKMLDFGVAKAAHRVQETQGNSLKGKIRYMSPEQCRADVIDRRSDIFSVAIVLWEMTLMRRLHVGNSEFQILLSVVQKDAPSPLTIDCNYPPELERIVMRGLERDPERRFQTLEEMQLELEAFARERKLTISQVALGRFMRELFADDVAAWQRAMSAGQVELAARSLMSPELLDEPDSSPFTSDPANPPPALPPLAQPPLELPPLPPRNIWPGLTVAACLLAVSALVVALRWRASAIARPPLQVLAPRTREPPPIAVQAMKPSAVVTTTPSAVATTTPSAPLHDSVERRTKKRRPTLHNVKPPAGDWPAQWDPDALTPP
jgi:serine/threonine protein kinase